MVSGEMEVSNSQLNQHWITNAHLSPIQNSTRDGEMPDVETLGHIKQIWLVNPGGGVWVEGGRKNMSQERAIEAKFCKQP